jgi:hypothetical protein
MGEECAESGDEEWVVGELMLQFWYVAELVISVK